MLFLCYPKCSTCQKAKKWLDAHNIEYKERHIAEENPTYDELREWYKQSGLPLKKFFNTSGLVYKEMQLKGKAVARKLLEQYNFADTDILEIFEFRNIKQSEIEQAIVIEQTCFRRMKHAQLKV